jgi:hypothetical protein
MEQMAADVVVIGTGPGGMAAVARQPLPQTLRWS